jgi:hypothetical protein
MYYQKWKLAHGRFYQLEDVLDDGIEAADLIVHLILENHISVEQTDDGRWAVYSTPKINTKLE